MQTTRAFLLSIYLAFGLFSALSKLVDASTTQDADVDKQQAVLSSLQRHIPLGRFRPSEEELIEGGYTLDKEFDEKDAYETEYDSDGRELQMSLKRTCNIILDSYLGKNGVERIACQKCRRDPNNWYQFILTCDFSDLCEFCSPQNDVCYTLTHEYTVRPWRGRLRQAEDIAYSACGIMHDGGEKVCLDETYKNWGFLDTQCVSVDNVSCKSCKISNQCGAYKYECGNIEPGFVMDGCDSSFNDRIPKSSVFVGFNYGLYEADTSSCFAKDGRPGNLYRHLRGLN